ncbi:MAG: nuclear transport factor 2 family protein [Deltaproteobacteria bacterium]|nr:nuclear transport factor 2 family protein [Deltaproteobacteria bacterium]
MRPRVNFAACALALASLAGCAQQAPRPADATGAAPRAAPADLAAALRRADAAFARSVADRDEAAFRDFLEEEAVFVGGAGLLRGRDEVFARWRKFLEEGGPVLRWAPTGGDGAASGDMGWTVGSSRYEGQDASGKQVAADGRYLTVWHRSGEAPWRVAFDMSLAPAAEHEPMNRTPARALTSADGALEATIGTWSHDGVKGPRRGAFLTVRARRGAGWEVVHDSAVAFAR